LRESPSPSCAISPRLLFKNYRPLRTKTLECEGINAWLLVAPTKGINVWCAAGGGHFTTNTVVSIIKTSGIEELVDHRQLVLPQLSGTGVNAWSVKERTEWKPRFGPAHVKDLPAYLRRGKSRAERLHRHVEFNLKDRLVMGTNLASNDALLLAVTKTTCGSQDAYSLGQQQWSFLVRIVGVARDSTQRRLAKP